MPLISNNFHNKMLKKYKINIKTKYIVGNEILERNTDNSYNDDINNGIRCEKDYYINGVFKHKETMFDSRIEYSFISKEEEDKDYTCPNCGMSSKLKYFIDGCPYCDTYYNIDYTDKELGSKHHYDRILKSRTYKIITLILDIVLSLFISFIFIKKTSRTFNSYDISKIFIYGAILSAILYYFFYIIDAYIILTPIKNYKDKLNQKQIDFWKRTGIDKKTFFNNLNYELGKYYYNQTNVIDYDIIDYTNFNDYFKNDKLHVDITMEVRIVYFENNNLKVKFKKDKITLMRHENGTINLKKGENIMNCYNCGASIDVTKGKCVYCDSKIKYLQEWILVEK